MTDKYKIIISTVPDEIEAGKIARTLLENRYVACVNIIPNIESLYWWQGKIESSREYLLIMKTVEDLVEETIITIKSLHSYEVPEAVVIPIENGFQDYLNWIKESVK
jgi:periplasmic divalent cation tolerance protein